MNNWVFDAFVLVCAWRWVRSQRSWRPTSTWSSRSDAASCPSPAPAAHGSGDQPVQPRITGVWATKLPATGKVLVLNQETWARRVKREAQEIQRSQNTWTTVYLVKRTYSHCDKAQQILQSCDVNPPSLPPLMLAPSLLISSQILLFQNVHLVMFSMNIVQVCAPCYCLNFPDFIIPGT